MRIRVASYSHHCKLAPGESANRQNQRVSRNHLGSASRSCILFPRSQTATISQVSLGLVGDVSDSRCCRIGECGRLHRQCSPPPAIPTSRLGLSRCFTRLVQCWLALRFHGLPITFSPALFLVSALMLLSVFTQRSRRA